MERVFLLGIGHEKYYDFKVYKNVLLQKSDFISIELKIPTLNFT